MHSGKLRTWPANTIFGTRWSTLAPAIVGILSQNPIAEGSRRGNPAGSGGRGLVLGCGKPKAVPPSRPPLRRVSAKVCDEARDPLRVTLCQAVKQPFSGSFTNPERAKFSGTEEEEVSRCFSHLLFRSFRFAFLAPPPARGNADIPNPLICTVVSERACGVCV